MSDRSTMPDSNDASAPVASAVVPPAESRTTALYRAALGPLQASRYLAVFARFDAAGRPGLRWHPAAAFTTLSWLVFRRLWVEALGYALIVLGVLALLVWQWPRIQAWPVGLRWGVLGALLLLSVVLPGLLAHAVLHRRIQQRLLRAVAAASSMSEACAQLQQQAASRRRLQGVLLANGLALAGMLLAASGCPPAVCPADIRLALGISRPPVADAPLAPVPPALAAPLPAPKAASIALPVVAPDLTLARVPEPVVPSPPVSARVVLPPDPDPVNPAPAKPPAPTRDSSKHSKGSESTETARAAYAINVGLFADEGNARRAYERLRQADVPATLQPITTPQGPRSRVRAGPFAERAAAEAAAQRIRALGLEAVVFRP